MALDGLKVMVLVVYCVLRNSVSPSINSVTVYVSASERKPVEVQLYDSDEVVPQMIDGELVICIAAETSVLDMTATVRTRHGLSMVNECFCVQDREKREGVE
jgi:hypothetical protein